MIQFTLDHFRDPLLKKGKDSKFTKLVSLKGTTICNSDW